MPPDSPLVLSKENAILKVHSAGLRGMWMAGSIVLERQRLVQKTGHNIVGEVLRGAGTFTEWNHYPEGDARDPEAHSQYYYHAHPPDGRDMPEHGHFHLFLRERGMPSGVAPAPGQSLPEGDNAILCHLVAVSMDEYGIPIRLFTVNRWVTGDVWYPAGDVGRMLDRFDIDVVSPNLAVNRWISAIVKLFRPQIVSLLDARDSKVDEWRRSHPGEDVFEDRRLEVTSMMDVSVDEQMDQISRRLGRRPQEISAA